MNPLDPVMKIPRNFPLEAAILSFVPGFGADIFSWLVQDGFKAVAVRRSIWQMCELGILRTTQDCKLVKA